MPLDRYLNSQRLLSRWMVWKWIAESNFLFFAYSIEASYIDGSGNNLAQVIVHCLTAPGRYLQIWLTMSYSHEGNFTGNVHDIYTEYQCENWKCKTYPGRYELTTTAVSVFAHSTTDDVFIFISAFIRHVAPMDIFQSWSTINASYLHEMAVWA